MDEVNILKKCPCRNCLVRSMCRVICRTEINFYNTLSEEEKNIYMKSELYQSIEKGSG
ncbi:MAG: hypothetical protein ACFFG0_00360 [Candidatus Thorarchaeota archaeon]